MEKLFSNLSNLPTPDPSFQTEFLKKWNNTGGKWLIHATKQRKAK